MARVAGAWRDGREEAVKVGVVAGADAREVGAVREDGEHAPATMRSGTARDPPHLRPPVEEEDLQIGALEHVVGARPAETTVPSQSDCVPNFSTAFSSNPHGDRRR